MPDIHEIFQKRIVLPFYAERTCRVAHIQYETVQSVSRGFDLYEPQEIPKNGHPVVILIHGEAPLENLKDSGQCQSIGEWLASEGIAVIAFNHATLLQGKTIEDVLNDLRELVRHIVEHHARYHLDNERIGMWAFSGGTQFALYLALKEFRQQIKNLVLYYGCMTISDLVEMFAAFLPIDRHLGDNYDDIETLFLPSGQYPGMFIARAGLDRPEINRSIDQSLSVLLRQNVRLALYNHEQGQHAFDILDEMPRSREILHATLSHLQQM